MSRKHAFYGGKGYNKAQRGMGGPTLRGLIDGARQTINDQKVRSSGRSHDYTLLRGTVGSVK